MKRRKGKIFVILQLITVLVIIVLTLWLVVHNPQKIATINVKGSESTNAVTPPVANDNSRISTSADSTSADDIAVINEQTDSTTEESSSTDNESTYGASSGESLESADPGTANQDTEAKGSDSSKVTPTPADKSSTSRQTKSNESLADETEATKEQVTGSNKATPTPVIKNSTSNKTESNKNTASQQGMTDSEYQKVKDTVKDYGNTAAKATAIQINPIALSLSGLESSYNAVMNEGTELLKQIDEFNSISSGIMPSEITGSNRDTILSASSEISQLNSSLNEDLAELKTVMKLKDLVTVGKLLENISKNCSDSTTQVEIMNNSLITIK